MAAFKEVKERTCRSCGLMKLVTEFNKAGKICHECKDATKQANAERRLRERTWATMPDEMKERRRAAMRRYQKKVRENPNGPRWGNTIPDDVVREARRRYKRGNGTALSAELGISQTALSNIVRGKTYKGVV